MHLALVLAIGVLLTNTVLRPLTYRLHPVLPEAAPLEIKLVCRNSGVDHVRALLLTTISNSPVALQAIHSEEDEAKKQTAVRAELATIGRNNEALEQIVMRLSIEDAVATLSWSIAQATIE